MSVHDVIRETVREIVTTALANEGIGTRTLTAKGIAADVARFLAPGAVSAAEQDLLLGLVLDVLGEAITGDRLAELIARYVRGNAAPAEKRDFVAFLNGYVSVLDAADAAERDVRMQMQFDPAVPEPRGVVVQETVVLEHEPIFAGPVAMSYTGGSVIPEPPPDPPPAPPAAPVAAADPEPEPALTDAIATGATAPEGV